MDQVILVVAPAEGEEQSIALEEEDMKR